MLRTVPLQSTEGGLGEAQGVDPLRRRRMDKYVLKIAEKLTSP